MIWLEHVYPWVKSMKWVLKFMHINSFPPYFIIFLVPISLFRKPFTILQLKKGSSCNREGEARAASSEEELKGKQSVPSTNICFFQFILSSRTTSIQNYVNRAKNLINSDFFLCRKLMQLSTICICMTFYNSSLRYMFWLD